MNYDGERSGSPHAGNPADHGGNPVIIKTQGGGFGTVVVALAVIALLGIVVVGVGFVVLMAFATSRVGDLKMPDAYNTVRVAGDRKAKALCALIPIDGVIMEQTASGPFGATANIVEETKRRLERAAKDDVKGVILQVNSPGGGITASDLVYRAILAFREENPDVKVVVWMKDLAASGGYYVSAPADWIVAMPSTLTASIGVVLMHTDLTGLTEGKLGVEMRPFTSGNQKDILSSFRKMRPAERAHIQSIVDDMFNQFVDVVVAGRKDKVSREGVIALQGTVLSGRQALEKGLVDQLGSLDDAVAKVSELVGVEKLRVIRYDRRPSVLQEMLRATGPKSVDLKLPFDPERYLKAGGSPLLYMWSAR